MAVHLEAATPPRADRAVVFACDGQYARYAMVAAEQIARLHPERGFDICMCYMDERPPEPAALANRGVRYCRVTTGDLFDGLRLDPGRTQVVYLRLALPAAFSGEYRRLLYLDGDVFVQGGRLRGARAARDRGGPGRFAVAHAGAAAEAVPPAGRGDGALFQRPGDADRRRRVQ